MYQQKLTHRALGDGAVNGYPQKLRTKASDNIRSRHDMQYDVCAVFYREMCSCVED